MRRHRTAGPPGFGVESLKGPAAQASVLGVESLEGLAAQASVLGRALDHVRRGR